MFKELWRSKPVQESMGWLLAAYLRLVKRTNSMHFDPPDAYAEIEAGQPAIVAMWHGQHFMIPFFRKPEHRISVLISRHGDGEMNAIAAERLGIGLVRGSGAQRGDQVRKRGGIKAMFDMLTILERGENMALTADVPKVSRVCGKGIVTLAQKSGRPIYAIAVVCSRRIDLKSWDRSSIGLPFGKCGIAVGRPVRVSAEASPGELEAARLEVQAELDRVHEVAYRLVGSKDPGAGRDSVEKARAAAAAEAAAEAA
jgi:lysophospholipid acyltransferase (LPLAT)-like uncharacterized protein